jgi:hypothetical protein
VRPERVHARSGVPGSVGAGHVPGAAGFLFDQGMHRRGQGSKWEQKDMVGTARGGRGERGHGVGEAWPAWHGIAMSGHF